VEHPHAVCMASWYLASSESKALLEELRESEPGGMAHACELETSLYLAIAPELVQMDRAVREIPDWDSENMWMDWTDGPLSIMPHWSGWSESGVLGDATVATAAKGEAWLEAAVEEIGGFIEDIATRRRRPGKDHHEA
jgi:creatinine amidohydrolase